MTYDPQRWYALLIDEYSEVFPDPEHVFANPNTVWDTWSWEVHVATGSALPLPRSSDGVEPDEWTMPGTWKTEDQAHDWTCFVDLDDAQQKWLDAVAIAESRNARQAVAR